MRVPLWLKIVWSIWVLVWVPVYWRQYGAQNFLYFCDLGNILIAVGLWLESPLRGPYSSYWNGRYLSAELQVTEVIGLAGC